jgi:formate--tetrahydrofolate ligase
MRPARDVLSDLGIDESTATLYGRFMAKIPLSSIVRRPRRGKLVLVTGMTPTPHGEGKTVVSIGLAMGLEKIGKVSVACIRQPSLGPVFGVKGGGAGGGKTRLEPMQEINLRLTGDIDAIAAAHNLLSAAIDNHIFHGNALGIDPDAILWPRVLDVEDRALRLVRVGLQEKAGSQHEGKFIITAASEVMAILCLSTGYADLKSRLSRIVVAETKAGGQVTAEDLKVVGAMAALLKQAMEPNLVQTCEGTPALVHGGPFGNIAHGTCSIVSIRLALATADYVVVEAGFGSDLGGEKFIDLVGAAASGMDVDAAVIVATARALRHHGGGGDAIDADAVARGTENLAKHIENVRTLGLRPVVAMNLFQDDGEDEVKTVAKFCAAQGIPFSRTTAFLQGAEGATALATTVLEEAEKGSKPSPLYERNDPFKDKVSKIALRMYGAAAVAYTPAAETALERIVRLGYGSLPVCVAKTPNSLSDDPKIAGRPAGFTVVVTGVELAAGAGYLIAEMGDISRMPGLPSSPAAERIALSDDGDISGIY